MIIDKNNIHDFPLSDIFKWIIKNFIAVMIVTNTFPIIIGIFDVAQNVVNNYVGVIMGDGFIN